jgi:hypothetical protein
MCRDNETSLKTLNKSVVKTRWGSRWGNKPRGGAGDSKAQLVAGELFLERFTDYSRPCPVSGLRVIAEVMPHSAY